MSEKKNGIVGVEIFASPWVFIRGVPAMKFLPPEGPPEIAFAGRSNVGFAASKADATARLGHAWAAYQAGHEIASHGCGHFDGGGWTAAEWAAEFEQFSAIVESGWQTNGVGDREPAGWRDAAHWEHDFRSVDTGEAERRVGHGAGRCAPRDHRPVAPDVAGLR